MATRHNLCPNPACGANVTGWAGGATPSQVTGLTGFPVTTGAKYTSGSFITLPTGAASAATQYTMSAYIQNNTGFDQNNKTLYFAATRSAGGDDFSQTKTVSLPNGTITRIDYTATAVANTTGIYLLLDGINATLGTGVTATACLIEQAAAVDTYFDGNSANASWDGTADNSTSTLTTSQTIAPDSLSVSVSIGAPTVSQTMAVTPDSLSVPVSLGQPTVSQSFTVAPNGLSMPVSLGQPTLEMAAPSFACSPDSLSVPVTLGEPEVLFTAPQGSWTQLSSIVREARADHARNQRRLVDPIDCPEHGWPLERTSRGLHCMFGGHVVG